MTRRQEANSKVAELKMLRFALGVAKLDKFMSTSEGQQMWNGLGAK